VAQFASINDFLNRAGVILRLRVEVLKDDGTTWLDLTDMVSSDRLASLPGLTNRQERSLGSAEVSLSTLRMDNADRFWDKVPPAGITTWLRRRIRASLLTGAGIQPLGIWIIDDLETASDDTLATLTLVTLSKRLFDKQADRVKNGRDWYTNRPIGWLVREALAQEFTRAEIQSWPNVLTRYQIPLGDPTKRALSTYGRPPEFDGSVWRNDGTTLYGSPYVVVNAPASANYGKHWFGIGGELWRWDPDTDIWTKLCGMPAGRTNFKIFHLYVNATRNKVIAVAWEIDAPAGTYPTTTGDRSGAKSGDVAILWADMTTPPAVLQEFAGKPANIFTGHYCVRAGRSSGGTTNIGAPGSAQLDANCAGINIPVPAGHYTRQSWLTAWAASTAPHTKKKTTYNAKPDAAEQGGDVTANGSWRIDLAGYYAPFNPIAADPMDYRWSLGQFRGAFAHQNAGDEFVCSVISWSGTVYRCRLWKLNTNTGTWTDTTEYVMAGNENLQPLSFQFRADDAKLLCASVAFRETAWSAGAPVIAANEPFSSAVSEFDWPLVDSAAPVGRPTGGEPHLNTNAAAGTNPERYWAIYFDAIYGASDYILLSGIDVRNMLGGNGYTCVAKQISTGNFGLYFNTPPGFAFQTGSVGRISGAVYEPLSSKFYVHDAGANQIRSIAGNSVDTGLTTWAFEDTGYPPVAADPSLLMGLVRDAKRATILGVSGPGSAAQSNAEILNNGPLSGKYYLWQLASWLTDRIEIADFTDMLVKDALEELASLMDGVYGFDRSGQFYFKARPKPTTMVATLASNGREDVGRVPDVVVRKRSGSQKLFNVAEMVPSIAVLKPPDGAVRALARPATFARPVWNARAEVYQSNNRNLNLLLRCVKGGLPGSEDDGCVRKTFDGRTMVDFSPSSIQRLHRLRFAYLMYDTVIETQILQFIGGSPTTVVIPYEAGSGVRSLDPSADFVINNYPTADTISIGDSESYQIRTVTLDPVAATATLRLDPLYLSGPGWPAGTKVTLRLFGNNRWSDSQGGVTRNASTFGGSGSVGSTSTMDFYSTRELSAGMVLRYEGGEEARVLQVLNATQALVRRGIGGTTPYLHVLDDAVQGLWAPIVSADFPDGFRFNIGGTGVSLRFADLPDPGEPPFMVGDTIEIVCPGLVLEAQDKAKIISYNAPSIQIYGKLPWSNSRQSRFAGYRQAQESCKRIVKDFGFPHFDLTCDMPLRWLPDINEGYLVEDLEGALPRASSATSPNGDNPPVSPDTVAAVGAMVEGYTIDPLNDRLTLNMRAINAHA